MNIVFVAHSSFSDIYVVGSHHLARRMAEKGHTVWHIGPPVTPFHLLRSRQARVRGRVRRAMKAPMKHGSLTEMDPISLVPWQLARRFLARGNLFVETSNLARRLKKVFKPGEIDILIIDDPRFAGLEQTLKPKATFYRATDFYAEMKKDPTLIEAERKLLARCAGVVSTSEPVLQHTLSLKPGLPSLLLENGVDYELFCAHAEEPAMVKDIPHPRVAYMGALDFRFDHELVGRLARRFPKVQFVLAGEGMGTPRVAALHLPNIHLLGPRPYEEMPGFLQSSDIGLLPLIDNLANAGRSPMKLYEYGAAGLPVLARRTRELARRKEKFVELFSDEEEAAQALERMLNRPVDRAAIARHCESQAWEKKTSTLLEFISGWLVRKRTVRVPTVNFAA